MNKVYQEHVTEAADRVKEIRNKMAECDDRIADLANNSTGLSPLALATERRAAQNNRATLAEALSIAEQDLKDISAQLKAYEKSCKDGGAIMAQLEKKQAENISSFLQTLDMAWDKAVEAVKVHCESQQVNAEYADSLSRSRTYHGPEYAQDVDKLLSFYEFNQPEDYKAAGIKTRHERGELGMAFTVNVISI
jgi:hypothetical protein